MVSTANVCHNLTCPRLRVNCAAHPQAASAGSADGKEHLSQAQDSFCRTAAHKGTNADLLQLLSSSCIDRTDLRLGRVHTLRSCIPERSPKLTMWHMHVRSCSAVSSQLGAPQMHHLILAVPCMLLYDCRSMTPDMTVHGCRGYTLL